ncbi:unnamed protein product [Psylliodes chrysocephalus]|uniref:Uncharacterized protein n=1 Tax=Psylliodes chrysocephalus TaxID=3402493 RepID=A0A9P0GEB9_9CUCU|nr:unnamed protein product [Psylliodes chrysocephala]
MLLKLKKNFFNCLLPELVDPRVPRVQPSDTLFSKRAKAEEESRQSQLGNSDSRRSSGSSISPRSPLTLKLKRSIHHPYKHVSTPKPKDTKASSSRSSRDSQSRSQKSQEKTEKRHSSTNTSRDRGRKSSNETDLHLTPKNDVQKSRKNNIENFKIKSRENSPFYTPPEEERRGSPHSSPMMSRYSPDSDPTLNFESAENSPLNSSVINTFNIAYGYAIINNENSAENPPSCNEVPENRPTVPVNDPHDPTQQYTGSAPNPTVQTGASGNKSETSEKNSAGLPPTNANKSADKPPTGNHDAFPKFESAYKTLGMPSTVTAKVLNFGMKAHLATSSEDDFAKESNEEDTRQPPLLHKRKNMSPINQTKVQDTITNMETDDFQLPKKTKKFRANFIKLLEQKAASTITTNNRFEAISDSESESETEQPTNNPTKKGKATPNLPIKGSSKTQKQARNTDKTKTKSKDSIPPIVIDGSTDNHTNLTKDLKEILKGKYSIKYTNATTVIFTESEEDYRSLLSNIKEAEIPHHTYTSKADKTHAFVLRGMAKGTNKKDIEDDLRETYEIEAKETFLMTTNYRPLYLIVTDPAITLDYLNENVRVIENTRVTWELRRAVKSIIQCHRCQAWGTQQQIVAAHQNV